MRKMVGDGRRARARRSAASRAARRRGCARETGRQHHVLRAAELLDELKRLEHEADVAQPGARERARSLGGQDLPASDDLAGVGPIQPAEQV